MGSTTTTILIIIGVIIGAILLGMMFMYLRKKSSSGGNYNNPSFFVGSNVITYGLLKANFNGKTGEVISCDPAQPQSRVTVRFDDPSMGEKLIRITNLTNIPKSILIPNYSLLAPATSVNVYPAVKALQFSLKINDGTIKYVTLLGEAHGNCSTDTPSGDITTKFLDRIEEGMKKIKSPGVNQCSRNQNLIAIELLQEIQVGIREMERLYNDQSDINLFLYLLSNRYNQTPLSFYYESNGLFSKPDNYSQLYGGTGCLKIITDVFNFLKSLDNPVNYDNTVNWDKQEVGTISLVLTNTDTQNQDIQFYPSDLRFAVPDNFYQEMVDRMYVCNNSKIDNDTKNPFYSICGVKLSPLSDSTTPRNVEIRANQINNMKIYVLNMLSDGCEFNINSFINVKADPDAKTIYKILEYHVKLVKPIIKPWLDKLSTDDKMNFIEFMMTESINIVARNGGQMDSKNIYRIINEAVDDLKNICLIFDDPNQLIVSYWGLSHINRQWEYIKKYSEYIKDDKIIDIQLISDPHAVTSFENGYIRNPTDPPIHTLNQFVITHPHSFSIFNYPNPLNYTNFTNAPSPVIYTNKTCYK